MNGILIMAVIVCLVFSIGLGLGMLIVHQKLEWIEKDLNDLKSIGLPQTLLNETQIEVNEAVSNRLDSLSSREDRDYKRLKKMLDRMLLDVRALKMLTCGTADISEFLRIKTQVWSNLTPRLENVETIIGIQPIVLTQTIQDGLITKELPVEEEPDEEPGEDDSDE